jgi:hypothetical protein
MSRYNPDQQPGTTRRDPALEMAMKQGGIPVTLLASGAVIAWQRPDLLAVGLEAVRFLFAAVALVLIGGLVGWADRLGPRF